jgi:hypothetical protein
MTYTNIEEVLASYLIGNGIHCYPEVKKETDNNCVVYSKISTIRFRNQNKNVYMNKSHFLLSAYATSYSGVKALVKTIWEKLDMNTNTFQTSWISNEQDVMDIDSKLSRVDIDLMVLWCDGDLG